MADIDYQEVGILTGAGAVGGLFAWLTGLSAATSNSTAVGCVIALLGGAMAAGIGIYLLAASDTKEFKRCIFFAALLGISWEPVLASGRRLLDQSVLRGDIAEVKKAADELGAAGTNASPEKIKETSAKATEILKRLPGIDTPQVKSDARASLFTALTSFKMLAPHQPEALSAIETLGQTARDNGSMQVKTAAAQSLTELKGNPHLDAAAQTHATQALQSIQ